MRTIGLFALFTVFLLAANLTMAQVPHFILSSTSVQLRQHGQIEVLGDVTLTCDVAGTFPPSTTFTISFSPVFSIVNSVGGSFSTASGVALNARAGNIESEPATSGMVVGSARFNFVAPNRLVVALSGSAAVNDIIRIAGIRVNIAEANLPVSATVTATVSANPPNAFQIDNVTTLQVGFVLDEITASTEPADNLVICEPTKCQTAMVTINEKFPAALTSLGEENDAQHKPGGAPTASHGSQIILLLGNILPGETVSWPASVVGTGMLVLTLPSGAPTSFFNSSATATSYTLVYDVTNADIVFNETISIPLTFCPTAIPNPPLRGTSTVQVQLGPNIGTGFFGEVASQNFLSFLPNPLLNPPAGIETLTGVSCPANLVAQNFSLTPTLGPTGTQVTANFTILNTGAGTAGPSTTLFQINTNSNNVGPGDPVLLLLHIPSLGPGGNLSFNQSFTIPCNLSAGNHFIWMTLDANHTAAPGGASNNANALFAVARTACIDEINPVSQAFGPGGGTGNLGVFSSKFCPWSARSNDTWIALTSPTSGFGNFTLNYSVAVNVGSGPRIGSISIADKTLSIVQAGNSAGGFSASLNPNGGTSKNSSSQGPLTVVYGQMSSSSGAQPVALANFGLTQNGVLITEAGVPATPLLFQARLFLDLSPGSDSGVALVNPNNTPIIINLDVQDAGGVKTKRSVDNLAATLTLGPHAHLARFVSQLGLNLPSTFLGTLTLSSCTPFAAVNLRSATNGHGEFIVTTLPLADLSNPPSGANAILPQIVDGGGLPTQILLMNPSSSAAGAGTVFLFDDNGSPLPLDFGSGPQNTLTYSIPPNGMVKFSTTGAGALRVGYAVVTPTSGPLPISSGFFTSQSSSGIASQAGVPAAPQTKSAALFVETASSPLARNSGVAIVNANNAPANVFLNLIDLSNNRRSAAITIPANGHTARFISELFPALPSPFQGILTLQSNVSIAAVTLRLTKNQRGEDIFSTLPVADLSNPPMGALFLSQVVMGSGYQLQLILINSSNAPGNALINFFDDNGNAVPVNLQ